MNCLQKTARFLIIPLSFSLVCFAEESVKTNTPPAATEEMANQVATSTAPASKTTAAAPAEESAPAEAETQSDEPAIENVGSGGFNKAVLSMALQSNGSVVVGGQFSTYGGVQVGRGLARLDAQAQLDKKFTDNTRMIFEKGEVYAVALQPDGKILAGGNFLVHGRGISNWSTLARFQTSGKIDESFDGVLANGFDNSVLSLLVQPDGKILVGGNFSSFAGHNVGGIARLHSNGTLDQSFVQNMGTGIDNRGSVKSVVLQPDGKIIVAGDFTTFSGKKVDGIVRLSPDGTMDMDFYKTAGSSFFVGFPLLETEDMDSEAGLYLSKVILQPSGDILLGGEFISYDVHQEIYSTRVLRMDQSGKLDIDFIKNTLEKKFDSDVNSLLVTPEGKIVVGCGSPFSRLDSDGHHDKDFLMLAGHSLSGDVNAMLLQPDEKIIVAGKFNSYKGIKVGNIVRLNPDGTMDEHFVSGAYQ